MGSSFLLSLSVLTRPPPSFDRPNGTERNKPKKKQALLSRKLVELDGYVPPEAMIPHPERFAVGGDDEGGVGGGRISDLRVRPLDPDRLLSYYDTMGFDDLGRKVRDRIDGRRSRSTTTAGGGGGGGGRTTTTTESGYGETTEMPSAGGASTGADADAKRRSPPRSRGRRSTTEGMLSRRRPRRTPPRPEDYEDVPF